MKFSGLVFLSAFILGACATSYQSVSFYDFTGKEFQEGILPVTVEIPKELVRFKPQGGLASSSWVSPGDVKKVSGGSPGEPSDSFFATKLSMSLAYNTDLDFFKFALGGKPENSIFILKKKFEQHGMKDVEIKRHNVSGFPVLQIEANGANNMKLRHLYIGTKIATNTISIFFIGNNSDQKIDDEIWNNFVSSIVN